MPDSNKAQQFHFPGKEPDEEVIMVLRRHAVAIGKKLAEFAVGAIIPLVGYFVIRNYTDWLDSGTGLLYIFTVLLVGLFYLFILLFIYHAWVDYYLDTWIITSERVVAMEQKGLFNRVVSELRLNRIQDVSSEVKGLLPTFFKYGTVHVQTASENDKFMFSEVPHPEIAARRILELHEKFVGIDQQPIKATHQHMTSDHTAAPAHKEFRHPHEDRFV